MKNIISSSLSQVYEKHLYNGRIALYTKVHNFKCGELDLNNSTFFSVHRTAKNIMKMFSGLGINEHILTQYDFRFIVVPYNNSELKTTRLKWIKEGIKSPFCNDSVDSQIILPLHKINLEDTQPKKEAAQLTLFQQVV